MIQLQYALVVGAAIFCVGLAGMLLRRCWVATMLSLGVMNMGLAYSAVVAASWRADGGGEGLALVCIVSSAAMGAVGLAATLAVISARRSVDSDEADSLKW